MKVLITGIAGFIGFHLARKLKAEGIQIVGIDNLNDYYDVSLKEARLAELLSGNNYDKKNKQLNIRVFRHDLCHEKSLLNLFKREKFDMVFHLAAQAGVRYSLINPKAYINSNIVGFFNVLEACKAFPVKHLIFASSSSVYGLNQYTPYSENHQTDHPVSLYAATKKSNEVMAHAYAHLFNMPITGLRFFTVYGPWGRPDMAYYAFTKKILSNEPIDVYNNGNLMRDFTYIADIIEGIFKLMVNPPPSNDSHYKADLDPLKSTASFRILNIGNHNPVSLLDFINILEKIIGKKSVKIFKEMQPGDVMCTCAETKNLSELTGFAPKIQLEEGLQHFYHWYQEYNKL